MRGQMIDNPTRRQFLRTAKTAGLVAYALSSLEIIAEDTSTEVNIYSLNDYIDAIIQIESSGNSRAERYEAHLDDHSYGLGQLLTKTAKDLEKRRPELPKLGESKEQIKNSLFNPEINRKYAEALFKEELDFYQNPFLAVAAYNAGHLTPRNARCQQQLNDLYDSQLKIDGAIGEKSKEIIRKFQKDYSLDQDGLIGQKTYAKLQEVWTKKFSQKENPKGLIPQNNYTPNHVEKFRKALSKN